MAGLTSDVIDQLGDISEGFSLMEEHGVSRDGCDTLEDVKKRLRLHLPKAIGQDKTIDAVSHSRKICIFILKNIIVIVCFENSILCVAFWG